MMSTDFVDINLLPHPRGATTTVVEASSDVRSRLRRLLAILTLAALFFLGTIYARSRNAQELAAQEAEIAALQQNAQSVSSLLTEVESLQQQITSLATQSQQLQADAERVERENPSLAPFLLTLTSALPPRMKITGIVANGPNRFLVQGEAGSDALVIEYANTLKLRPGIRAVTPSSIQQLAGTDTPGAVSWTLEVER